MTIFIFENKDNVINSIGEEINIIYQDSIRLGTSKNLLFNKDQIIINFNKNNEYKNFEYCLQPSHIDYLYYIRAKNIHNRKKIMNKDTIWIELCSDNTGNASMLVIAKK